MIADVTISGPANDEWTESPVKMPFVAEENGRMIAAFVNEADAKLFQWARHLETMIPPKFRPPQSAADVMLGDEPTLLEASK